MEQGFAVVLVAGLTVFGLAFIANESGLSTSQDPGEQLTLMNKSIGTVGDVTEDFRTVELGSFSVGEGRGDVQVYRSDSAEISNGLASSDDINFDYNASQPREGTLSFRVIGREGSGAVYFEVNGERVFEEPMTSDFSGTGTEINIRRDKLGPGVNSFELGTTSGGLLGSTTYNIEDIEFEINDRDKHERIEDFQMYTHELENFRGAELGFRIPADNSIPSNELEIRVNGETVSSETRAQGEYAVELTPENANLRPGRNTVRFTTSGRSFYRLENVDVQVDYAVTSDPEAFSERIELSESELSFIEREDTSEMINFNYVNLNNPNRLQIDLNNDTYSLTPENGENTLQLEGNSFEDGENILTLSSDGSFRIENLELLSRVEEQ